MPYLGRGLEKGNYLKLDDISSQFDGSKTTFNLTVGGSAHVPGSSYSLLVSLSGIVQEGEAAYTLDQNEITFAAAPQAADDCFIVSLGTPLGIGVPSNGTVNGTQLAKPLNYDNFFHLDHTNDRVGIGTSIPTQSLDVYDGNIAVRDPATASQSLGFYHNRNVLKASIDKTGNNLTFENVDSGIIDYKIGGSSRVSIGSTGKIFFASDDNTYFYRPGADTLGFLTGGTERLRITSGGQVRIANTDLTTSSSADDLIVGTTSGNRGLTIFSGTSNTGNIYFGDTDTTGTGNRMGTITYDHSGNFMRFSTSGNQEKLRITSTGEVGIGTTNPQNSAKVQYYTSTARHQSFQSTDGDLAIVTDNNSNPAVYIKGTGTADLLNVFDNTTEVFKVADGGGATFTVGTTERFHVDADGTTTHGTLQVDGVEGGDAQIRIRADQGDDNNDLFRFLVEDGGHGLKIQGYDGSFQTRITLDTSGLVGIGITAPEGKGIDVSHSRTNGYSGTGDTRNLAHIIARNPNDGSDKFAAISLINGAATQAEGSINLVQTGNYTGDLTFKIRTAVSSWQERVRIKSDGKVGIGTNNPGHQLDGASDLVVGNQGEADSGMTFVSATNGQSLIHFSDATSGNARYDGFIGYEQTDRFLKFGTAQEERLRIDSSGHITPGAAGTQDLGSTSKEWGDLYFANSKGLKLGSSQVGDLYNDGTDTYFRNSVSNGQTLIRSGGNIWISDYAGNHRAAFRDNSAVDLYYDIENNATAKLSTTVEGISVYGEVAASQDYPNYRPTLDLNFAAVKKLDPRIKYTRTGYASYHDENGKLIIVNSNVPRFDHDPDTGECKGLLIEESRTNIIVTSATGTVNTPNLGGVPQTNNTPDGITLPTGGTGNVRQFLGNAAGGGIRFGDFSGTANTTYTGSMWVRTVSGTGAVTIDMNDGGVQNNIPISTEWKRISSTHSTNNTYRFCDLYFETPVTVYIWGVQIEEGEFMSSYIPTRGAAGTRGQDFVTLDGTDFSDFYNQSEGTLVSEFMINTKTTLSSASIVNLNSLSTDSYADSIMFMEIGTASGYYGRVYKSSSGTALTGSGNITTNGIMGGTMFNKVSFAWSDTVVNEGLAAYRNGDVQDTSSTESNTPTNLTEMRIGRGWQNSAPINAHIKRLMYYPKRLPDSQLDTLTS